MKLLLIEAALVGAMAAIVGSNSIFTVGFALVLGASEFHIGLLSSLPLLFSSTQIFSNHIIEKIESRKKVCLLSFTLSRLPRIFIVALPWVVASSYPNLRIWLFIIIISFPGLVGPIGFVSRVSWLSDLIPESIRGRYFSSRIRALGASDIIIGILAGLFIDYCKTAGPAGEILGLQIIFAAGVAFSLASILTLRAVPEPKLVKSRENLSFLQTLRLPFQNTDFRKLLVYSMSWNFSLGFAGPFFLVYMFKYLEVPYLWIAVLAAVGEIASLYAVGFWGRLADKFGNKPILTFCATVKAIFPVLWVFVSPGSYILLFLVHLVRCCNSGQQLTTFNLVLKLSPDENKAMYISSHKLIENLSGSLSPIIGGALAVVLIEYKISLFFYTLYGLHFLFILSAITRSLSVFLLRRIDEPQVKTVGHVIRVLRHIDGFTPADGIAEFAHFWFSPVVKVSRTVIKGGKAIKKSIGTMTERRNTDSSSDSRQ